MRDDVGRRCVSPRNSSRQRLRVQRLDPLGAGGEAHLLEQRVDLQVGIRIAQSDSATGISCVLARMRVRPWRTVCSASARGADDDVAGQHRVGLLGVDAHLVQRASGTSARRTKRQHRAALLREAHEVEHAGRLAFEMRGHRDHRADGDHAGAADAGDEQVVRAGPGVRRRAAAARRRGAGRRRAPAGQRAGSSCAACRRSRRRSSGRSPWRRSSPCCSSIWSILRLRPSSVSSGSTATQFAAPSSRRSLRRRAR